MKEYDQSRLIALADGIATPETDAESLYVHAFQCAVLGETLIRTAMLVPDYFNRDRHELTMFMLGFDAGCVRESEITIGLVQGKRGWQ